MVKSLVIRSLSGLVFIVIVVSGLLFHPALYALLMLLIIGIITFEYFQITIGKKLMLAQGIFMVTGWLLFLLFYALMQYHLKETWFLLLVLPVITVWVSLLYQKSVENYAQAPNLFIPILYIALPFALTNLLVFDQTGSFHGMALLTLFMVLWASDVGAYVFGMAFGQKKGHKLFPSLSPKKSWEGFYGGAFTALLVAFILHWIGWFSYPLVHCFVISLLLHIFGVWGDLAESQLKRHYQVKDSGKLMPGHGGLLDRFDSALIAFPIVIVYIKLLSL